VSPKITNFMGFAQQVARPSAGNRHRRRTVQSDMDSAVRPINPAIVRAYDIRGRVGQQLVCDDAYALGLAYSGAATAKGSSRVAVCRDGRCSSESLEGALVEGLLDGGMRVCRVGLGPTPMLYYAVHSSGLDGGIMVTGSHNPKDENGFKLLLAGNPVFGRELQALVARAPVLRARGSMEEVPPARNGCTAQGGAALNVVQSYAMSLAALAGDAPALHVVWDCGNGATGAVIGALTDLLPGKHTLLNSTVDGEFPAHHPDPAVAENLRQLQEEVLHQRADIGIAFDGDGDRIGVVDSTGTIVWPDQLLLLLATDLLAANPGAAIVGDVKSSDVLFSGTARLGGRPVMSPAGYVLVRDVMLREKAPLAGEMSGHILFADCWHGTDDALFVAMRVLAALGRQRLSLAEFRCGLPPTFATPEMRLPCPDERKHEVIQEVAARLSRKRVNLDTTDGLRVSTPQGWWLLRASGSESKLTARCEAVDAEGLQYLKRQLRAQLLLSGFELPANQ
jgi:phosphomannomutase